MKLFCFKAGDVILTQTGTDRFTVTYGKQVKKGLDYATAASELGACIMHECACEGKLDNRTREEARTEARADAKDKRWTLA